MIWGQELPNIITQPAHYIEGRKIEPISVKEWKLSLHLEKALSCILHSRLANFPRQKSRLVVKFSISSKELKSFYTELPLFKAMEYLRLEISNHEGDQSNEQH